MKSKYDWQAIKMEFFKSDIDEVEWFFQDKFKTKTDWSIRKNTKGWTKEKQEHKDKILQEALKKKAEEDAKALELPLDELRKAKKAVLLLLVKRIKGAIEDDNYVSVNEREKMLKMIKTELWEPTNITKTDATIKSEPLDESLFIQN